MSESLRPRDLRQLTVRELSERLAQLPEVEDRVLQRLAKDARSGVRRLAGRIRARQRVVAQEAARLDGLFVLEREHRALGYEHIAGVDEAGVAPLAGPVVAAAVILPPNAHLPSLNDSKQVPAEMRESLFDTITRVAVAVAVAEASVEEIDRLNILQATRLAHKRALEGLDVRPHLVLIDGLFPADVPFVQLPIIDGDATCASVAAASIVAKVTRDRLMVEFARRFPDYGFARNKGYGTRAHFDALRRFGMTVLHRRSFFPLKEQQGHLAIGSPAPGGDSGPAG